MRLSLIWTFGLIRFANKLIITNQNSRIGCSCNYHHALGISITPTCSAPCHTPAPHWRPLILFLFWCYVAPLPYRSSRPYPPVWRPVKNWTSTCPQGSRLQQNFTNSSQDIKRTPKLWVTMLLLSTIQLPSSHHINSTSIPLKIYPYSNLNSTRLSAHLLWKRYPTLMSPTSNGGWHL